MTNKKENNPMNAKKEKKEINMNANNITPISKEKRTAIIKEVQDSLGKVSVEVTMSKYNRTAQTYYNWMRQLKKPSQGQAAKAVKANKDRFRKVAKPQSEGWSYGVHLPSGRQVKVMETTVNGDTVQIVMDAD